MFGRLKCLLRRHDWHSEYDHEQQRTRWTCQRCGALKRSFDSSGTAPPPATFLEREVTQQHATGFPPHA